MNLTTSSPKASRKIGFEFLLFSLMMVLFNKIFVPNLETYNTYIWPINMVLLGIGSISVYRNKSGLAKGIFYLLFIGIVVIPFITEIVFSNQLFGLIVIVVYILFYLLLFLEVMRQITGDREITLSVVIGSLCGFLLLVVIAIFSFLLLENLLPGSFSFDPNLSIPEKYIEMSYFSMVTLTTIGYGDVLPVNDSAKLLASFYGIIGQFYMVALIGIIISKYSSNKV